MKTFPKALISLPIVGLVTTLAATPSVAARFTTTGDIQYINPPPRNVRSGQTEDNDTIFLFEERQNVWLLESISVDITSSKRYDSSSNRLTPGTISANTPVNSYFLHFDRKGNSYDGKRASGTVTFDEEILGLIVLNTNHNASNRWLGNPGTIYAGRHAALELSGRDSINWYGNALQLNLRTTQNIDQLRVITERSVAPSLTSLTFRGNRSSSTIFEGDSVSAFLSATDPNKDTISFFLDGNGIGTDYDESGTRSQGTNLGVFDDEGTFSYTALAKDEDGKYSNTLTRILTVKNAAPRVTGFKLLSNEIYEGESVEALLYAKDPGADAIYFFLNEDLIGTDYQTSGTRSTSTNLGIFEDDGTFSYSVQARDEDGAYSNPFTLDLKVKNLAPTITSLTDDLTIYTDTSFNFAATATDPGILDILTYQWDFDGDGLFDDFIGNSGDWLFSGVGEYEVNLRVSDGDGGFDYESFTVTVEEPMNAKSVPEPGAIAGLGAIVASFAALRRHA